MNKHLLRSFVFIAATLFPICLPAQQTEVSVLKGKVLAENEHGKIEAVAGQRAVLGASQKPVVTPDNQMVSDLLELDKMIEQEKRDSKIRIDFTDAQITRIDSENEWTLFSLAEMRALGETTTTVRIGLTSLLKSECFYEMNGREIPFERKEMSPGKGYYFLHFDAPAADGKYKFISVATVEPKAGWLTRDESVWHLRQANDTQYSLNYFKVVLPTSAVFVEAKPAAFSMEQVDGRAAITIRNYTGKEANGRYRVTFLWPEHDGTTIKDIPAGLRGVYDQIDEKQVKEFEGQVLPLMQEYQKACRERNAETCMKFNPYVTRETLDQMPELFELIGKTPVVSVKLDRDDRYSEYRPVVRASGGECEYYWRQTAGGWKIFSQEFSGKAEKILNHARAEQQKNSAAQAK